MMYVKYICEKILSQMKIGLISLFFGAFLVLFSTYFYEYLSLQHFKKELESGRYGIPRSSFTYKYAKKTKIYIPSMLKAVSSKLETLNTRIFNLCIYALISTAFLIKKLRIKIANLSTKMYNLYFKTIGSISKEQIGFTNLFVFLFIVFYLNEYIKQYISLYSLSFMGEIILYVVLYIFICPIIVVLLFVMIHQFGAQFIIALYLSLLIKTVYELFIENNKSPNLEKLSFKVFDKVVQDYLKKTGLENKVYVNRNFEDTNAALVGLGENSNIELYGNFEDLPHAQQNSVLLHEIGHAVDHSLLKKLCVYFCVYFAEMIFILYLLKYGSSQFKTESISQESAFFVLTTIYFFFIKEWLDMFYKLSSQRAETAADLLAKNEGYGEELAKSLFEISVQESSYIRPSWLYNALFAMHASIYNRIESLKK